MAEQDEAGPGPTDERGPREWVYLAELIGIATVVVAQPVLDVVQDAPEEFVLRRAEAAVVVAFGLIVALGPPLVLWLAEQPVRLMGRRARDRVHGALLGIGVGLFAMTAVKSALGGGRRPMLAFVGLGVAAVGVYLMIRFRAARQILRYVGLLLPVVLGLYLFASPVSDLVFGDEAEVADVEVAEPTPVVLVVLDELPLMSLLDGEGAIDEARFPAFAELAELSTWYRNHTTVASTTFAAVPAIVTGQIPEDPTEAPIAATYDESIFTLLGGSYEVRAEEDITDLCPPSVCGDLVEADQPAALRSLLRTGTEVLGDLVSPRVDQRQATFEVGESGTDDVLGPDRDEAFPTELLGAGATLDFAHVVLPHQPWIFLPSGASYEAPRLSRGVEFTVWFDEWSGLEGRERHLLQLQYVDHLLGRMLDRLRAEPWFDESMLVVTADHGVSFGAGQSMRGIEEGNYHEMMWAPLFVKYPGQRGAEVDDRPAETIDIVPTIADELGIEAPWGFDGFSLLGQPVDRPARARALANFDPAPVAGDGLIRLDRAAGFARVLEGGPAAGRPADDPDALLRTGPYGDLIGSPVERSTIVEGEEMDLTTQSTSPFTVPADASELPAYVEASWAGPPGDWVAVSVDGTVAGLSASFPHGQDGATFWTMLAERLLTAGEHELAVYRITGPPSDPVLHPFRLVEGDP